MTDALERLLQRSGMTLSAPVLLAGALVIMLCGASGWLAWSSWQTSLQLAVQRATVQEAEALITDRAAYHTDLETQVRAVEADTRLASTRVLADALQALSGLAATHHLSLVVQQPPTTRADIRWRLAQVRMFQETPLALELTGRYRNIGEFLGSLSAIPFLNTVRRLVVDPAAAEPAGTLRATIDLSVFIPQGEPHG